ncbi:MAG: hypothetical protein Q9163_006203 [Psora crenata]
MSSRAGLRLFQYSRTARTAFSKPLGRRCQTTDAAAATTPPAQSTFQRLWNSPVGVKTGTGDEGSRTTIVSSSIAEKKNTDIQLQQWAVVLAGISDFARPAESLSLTQNLALTATGAIWTRWCLIIKPRNIFLAAVNFFLGCVGVTQVMRIFLYQRSLKDAATPGQMAENVVNDAKHSAKGLVVNAEGTAKKASQAPQQQPSSHTQNPTSSGNTSDKEKARHQQQSTHPQNLTPATMSDKGKAPQQQSSPGVQNPTPGNTSDKGKAPQQEASRRTLKKTPGPASGAIPFVMANAQELGHNTEPPAAQNPTPGNTSDKGKAPQQEASRRTLKKTSGPTFGAIPFVMANAKELGHNGEASLAVQARPPAPAPAPEADEPTARRAKKFRSLSSMVNLSAEAAEFLGGSSSTVSNASAAMSSLMPPPANPAPPAPASLSTTIPQTTTSALSVPAVPLGQMPLPMTMDTIKPVSDLAKALGIEQPSTILGPGLPPAPAGMSTIIPRSKTGLIGSIVMSSGICPSGTAGTDRAEMVGIESSAVQQPSTIPGPSLPPVPVAATMTATPSVANFQARTVGSSTNIPAQLAVQQPARVSYDPNTLELQLEQWWKTEPLAFETLVGLYFQHSGRHPAQVGEIWHSALTARGWMLNPRRLDILEKNPNSDVERWPPITHDSRLKGISDLIDQGYQEPFERAIRWWSIQHEPQNWGVDRVLRRAGWVDESDLMNLHEWNVMHAILSMEECTEKTSYMLQAKEESPRWYDYCLKQLFCGLKSFKRKRVSQDADVDEEERVTVYYTSEGRFEQVRPIDPPPSKRRAMDAGHGRPTQIHGVPLEERALDSKGNRLPWGLEWHDDHPNARGQKRHVEEKGPFGKSNRRKGSTRSRTATPAKKENPTVDSFEKALNFTLSQEAQARQKMPASARIQNENNIASQHHISVNKEPTQVMIYGYSPDSEWAALDVYERSSYGMICEDYARTPPEFTRKYPTAFSSANVRRPLTRAEKAMAFKYSGGECWVKVTFDSAEAAERAVEHSPCQIHGHWVYAQLYHGTGPERDEPIPIKEGEYDLRRPRYKPHTIGASFAQRGNVQQQGGTTLPRSHTVNPPTKLNAGQANGASPSSSTATSGTATGVEYPDLRQRSVPRPGSDAQGDHQQRNPQMMTHFPEIPRTVLRPASEAFLAQPTWWERQVRWLSNMGLIPGEIIGNGIPRTEQGDLDLARASFYWRFFYWIDSHLGTDICGLRDDD